MKQNGVRYIFAIIVIGLAIYAAYILYGEKETIPNEIVEQTSEPQMEIVTNIRVPVVSFDTINPILSRNQNIQDISKLIYEPLLDIDDQYKIKPVLAKEWSKTSPTSYVIKLKEGIKWHDGNMLTARDVQFTIDRLKDENVTSIYEYNVQYVISVEVIDDYTIRINLGQEVPFFEYNLNFPIMSNKYFENEDFVNTLKNEHPVGTGRFKVGIENGAVVLKQNRNWWNIENESTKITEIYIMKYQNMGEAYNAFKIGNIDMLTTKSINVEDYIGTLGYNQKQYYGRELDFIAFNLNNNVLANVEVRKAISYAINKQNIVSGIYKDKYKISNFPLEFGSYVYENGKVPYEYNLDKAKSTLQENGWEYKSKNWRKVINYRTQKTKLDLVVEQNNPQRLQVAENIKNSLEEMGMQINIIKVTDAQYEKYLQNKNYDMILTGVYSAYSPDLSTYFRQNNLANFQNEEINGLLNEINVINDEKLLKEKYNKLIEIYNQQIPYIFLYYNQHTFVYNPKLVGEINPTSYNIFNGIGSWYRQ